MREIIEKFIQEILNKRDKNTVDDEVLAEIKKIYEEKSAERNESMPRFESKIKKKRQERYEREYKELIVAKEVKEARKVRLTGGI